MPIQDPTDKLKTRNKNIVITIDDDERTKMTLTFSQTINRRIENEKSPSHTQSDVINEIRHIVNDKTSHREDEKSAATSLKVVKLSYTVPSPKEIVIQILKFI